MKRIVLQVILLLCILLPVLSEAQKPFSFVRNKVKIDKLLVLYPATAIAVIQTKNTVQIDDSLSEAVYYKTKNIQEKHFPDTVQVECFNTDSLHDYIVTNMVGEISKRINSEKTAKRFNLPDSLFQIFDSSKYNYIFVQLISVL